MHIPDAVFAVFGALAVAFITSIFSWVSFVSAKENKVSEFRVSWIDGLRNEIASYTASLQELTRIEDMYNSLTPAHHGVKCVADIEIEHEKLFSAPFRTAAISLAAIQLRLNPHHAKKHPEGAEATLMAALQSTRDHFNNGLYSEAFTSCDNVKEAAAPLLKSTWDTVKLGESGYRNGRRIIGITVCTLFVLVIIGLLSLIVATLHGMFGKA